MNSKPRVHYKIISSNIVVCYSAYNLEDKREYKIVASVNDTIFQISCFIKDYFSFLQDRNQWALLLNELRKELRNDL